MINKIRGFVEKHKRLVAILVVILVISSVVILAITREGSKEESTTLTTPTPTITSMNESIPPIEITGYYPNSGEVGFAGSKNSISIFFDTEVDPKSVRVTATPYIRLIPKIIPDNPDRIVLAPQTYWKAGVTYKIVIKEGIRDVANERSTEESIELEYVMQYPPTPAVIPPYF